MDYKKLIKEAQQEQQRTIRLYEDNEKAASRTAVLLMIVSLATLAVCIGILLFI